MKRLAVLSTLVVSVTLIGAGTVQAGTLTNEKVPISATITNPCNGEQFLVSGFLHQVVLMTVDESGGGHFGFSQSGQDLSGVDQERR